MSDPSWPNPDIGKKIAANIERLRAAARSIGAKEKIVGELGSPPTKEGSFGPGGSRVIGEEEYDRDVGERGGILTYEGQQITLHIYEHEQTLKEIEQHPKEKGYKVHFTRCATLTMMRNFRRYDKYVVGNRADGKFKCHLFKDSYRRGREDYLVRLFPCRKCLRRLDYKNFSCESDEVKDEIVKSFNYEQFFEENKPMLRAEYSHPIFDLGGLPRYTPSTYPKGGYPSYWSKVSRRTRENHGWKCQECGVFCGETKNRGLLHTHHKNRIPGDVIASNLIPLCIFCHCNEPGHGRMKPKQSDLNRLRRLQKEQGIETTG